MRCSRFAPTCSRGNILRTRSHITCRKRQRRHWTQSWSASAACGANRENHHRARTDRETLMRFPLCLCVSVAEDCYEDLQNRIGDASRVPSLKSCNQVSLFCIHVVTVAG